MAVPPPPPRAPRVKEPGLTWGEGGGGERAASDAVLLGTVLSHSPFTTTTDTATPNVSP